MTLADAIEELQKMVRFEDMRHDAVGYKHQMPEVILAIAIEVEDLKIRLVKTVARG